MIAVREQPGQTRMLLPGAINVSASCGVTVMNKAPEATRRYVDFLLAPAGQAILARHGFALR